MRRPVAALSRVLLIGLLGLLSLIQGAGAAELSDAFSCEEDGDTRIWISPMMPWAQSSFNVKAVSTDAPVQELSVFRPDGERMSVEVAARGGPPWSLSAQINEASAGRYRLEARRRGLTVACCRIEVERLASGETALSNVNDSAWNRAMEALFAAWIEQLFDAPVEESLSFPSLEPVLRNPERNFLYNHFGLDEDRSLSARPDCADLPYFLRGYFAWKMGLAIGFRTCSRGTSKAPPVAALRSSRKNSPRG